MVRRLGLVGMYCISGEDGNKLSLVKDPLVEDYSLQCESPVTAMTCSKDHILTGLNNAKVVAVVDHNDVVVVEGVDDHNDIVVVEGVVVGQEKPEEAEEPGEAQELGKVCLSEISTRYLRFQGQDCAIVGPAER